MVAAGDRLGGHLLVEPIGARGATVVWMARSAAGEQVMLDVTPMAAEHAGAVAERLRTHLLRAGAGTHENLLRVLDAGVEKGCRYVVSEYASGIFLSELIATGRHLDLGMSVGVAGAVARQIARALGVVHDLFGGEGRHRHHELSPATVYVCESGIVKVAELLADDDSQDLLTTASHDRSHGAGYVSPEVATSGRGDERSDLFALGVVLWEMLAGRPLFHRESDLATLQAVQSADVPSLPSHVPARLSAVTMRCLARDPNERYSAASLLEAALEAATVDQPDADPLGVSSHVADVLAARPRDPKRRTFALSDASQTGAPRKSASSASSARTLAPIAPSGAATAHAKPDPFFDVDRDGGGITNPRFEVLGRLGSGGMGEVYRVRDNELSEVVALKLIPAHSASEIHSLERLKREVRLARRIASEHVCRIFDLVDLGDGARGLTMALVNGTTLAELMKTRLSVDYVRFARWGADIADGLGAAHAVDIIHRDLKPENVMIDSEDRAVILDFGIARSQADPTEVDGKLTQAGIIMGTPLYMSPEQLANRELDGRSDLYALGLLIAELITGEVPLPGDNYADILDKRVVRASEYRYRIQEIDPGVPTELADIIDALLLPAASDRPADAADARRRFERFAEAKPADTTPSVSAAPVEIPRTSTPSVAEVFAPSPKRSRGEQKWFGMLAVLGVLAMVLIVWLVQEPKPSGAKTLPPPDRVPALEDAGTAADAGAPPDAGFKDAGAARVRPPPPPIVEEM